MTGRWWFAWLVPIRSCARASDRLRSAPGATRCRAGGRRSAAKPDARDDPRQVSRPRERGRVLHRGRASRHTRARVRSRRGSWTASASELARLRRPPGGVLRRRASPGARSHRRCIDRRVIPALHPKKQRRQEIALQIDAARVGWAARLRAEGLDRGVQPSDVAGRPRPFSRHGCPVASRGSRARPRRHAAFITETHNHAVQTAGALGHTHLATADQRDGVRLDDGDLAVEGGDDLGRMWSRWLVVVVAMRPARPATRVGPETRILEQHDSADAPA